MALTDNASNFEEKSQDFSALDKLFKGIAGFHTMLKILEAQGFEIKEIRRQLAELLRSSHPDKDRGWLDAKAAASYLGVSRALLD